MGRCVARNRMTIVVCSSEVGACDKEITVSPASFDFSGKVVLVTGGASGMGRGTALMFARHGAKVVIGDLNSAGLEVAESIKRENGDAIFVQTDVRDPDQVQNLVTVAVRTYGGLHCAFNNAGVLPPMAPMADTADKTFDEVFSVDVKGVFLAMKYEIQQMLQAGGGVIVNNASIAGLIAEQGISTYVAAKHAVIGLSKAAAIEYAKHGIRITRSPRDSLNLHDKTLVRRSTNARFLSREFADWPVRSAGRDREHGIVFVLGPGLLCGGPDICLGWRVYRTLNELR